MRALGPLALALAPALLAACSTSPDATGVSKGRQTRILGSRSAMYCLASARECHVKAEELERSIEEQRRIVARLRGRMQEVYGQAGRVRRNARMPKTLRESQALHLEGEGSRMRLEVADHLRLIATLEESASWYRRQAHLESQRISQIMHGDVPKVRR